MALLDVDYTLCCDDGRARQVGIAVAGEQKVVGSIRLLKWAVEATLCTVDQAFDFYQRMKDAGGFLPDISREWFNDD